MTRTAQDVLSNIVRPMVGPRCKTKDTHDFPDLTEDGRCLVCTTYDEVEEAQRALYDDCEAILEAQRPRPILPTDSDVFIQNCHGQNDAIDIAEKVLREYFGVSE